MPFDVGRYTVKETVVNVATTATRVVAANPRRVYLGFAGQTVSNVMFSTNPAMASTQGFQLGSAVRPPDLTWRNHGSLVCYEWWARGSAPSTPVTIFEVIEV